MALGLLSPLGVAAGVLLANALPVRALELGFAAVQVYFAYELMRRALRARAGSGRAPAGESA